MAIDRSVELSVVGLTCGHCVASLTEELSAVPGVLNVDVILRSGETSTATVVTDIELDDNALRDSVEEAGYELTTITRDFCCPHPLEIPSLSPRPIPPTRGSRAAGG